MRILILLVSLAHADSSVHDSSRSIVFRELEAAKKFGDNFDPRKLDPHHLGLYIEVYRLDDEWEAFLGEDDENCCEEPDYVKPPIWKGGGLRLEQAQGRGLYVCAKGDRPAPPTKVNREVLIVDRKDGSYDVTMCGRKIRMVRSESYSERKQRWSRAMAEKIIGKDLDCQTVAVDCDQNRLAAACPLPLKRTLLVERGQRPRILGPNPQFPEFSRLEPMLVEIDPPEIWCVSTR